MLQGRATRFNSYHRVGDNGIAVWVVCNDCTVLVSYNHWAVQEQVVQIVVEECNKSSMLRQQ